MNIIGMFASNDCKLVGFLHVSCYIQTELVKWKFFNVTTLLFCLYIQIIFSTTAKNVMAKFTMKKYELVICIDMVQKPMVNVLSSQTIFGKHI